MQLEAEHIIKYELSLIASLIIIYLLSFCNVYVHAYLTHLQSVENLMIYVTLTWEICIIK